MGQGRCTVNSMPTTEEVNQMCSSREVREPIGGTYVLLLALHTPMRLQIGRLGEFCFPQGYYAYVGSALGPGGLAARIARHKRKDKVLHWHLDYLTAHAEIFDAVAVPTHERFECTWARALLADSLARVIAPRLGASDCRCPAHLVFYGIHVSGEDLHDRILRQIGA